MGVAKEVGFHGYEQRAPCGADGRGRQDGRQHRRSSGREMTACREERRVDGSSEGSVQVETACNGVGCKVGKWRVKREG